MDLDDVEPTKNDLRLRGAAAGAGNQIEGNGAQITIEDSASAITFHGNIIGTDPSGTIDLSPEQLAAARRDAEILFQHVDLKHPVMHQIFELAVRRIATQQAEQNDDGA